ncbi:ABC transporter substrate-binding protein [Sinirhodobacter huangdaonensis]|uniref:ABC transporter substrate-binding protein n=1 Tax=Paenirhodobacter huangdaonensis TaxID=2501515 RepID=A0A3S3LN44_9RHOB|nr:ABC transporter substrate-binding protein [Sinirhodobacter huangdaonensis]RWR52846.1 ABC transporter substrate-binding protein [Sinirhodobacter huangdaonensis]
MRKIVLSLLLSTVATAASANTAVTFGTNWLAQAEHGGFYQAVADGTYAACGLDVTIQPGGPQVNNRALMLAGKIDFNMGGNLLEEFSAVQEGIPVVAVAAIFQKEPQVILTHPGAAKSFEDLKTLKLLIGDAGYASYYQWMIKAYGFTPEQREVYTFNPAPFIADEKSGMQGYLSSEPLMVEKEGGFKPDVWLLADAGYSTYSTLIETMADTVAKKPEVVKCFVDGSIKGWYNFLYGDNSAAKEKIKKDNPDMTDEQLAFGISQLKEKGIVDSGDALEKGIGVITDAHVKDFFDKMVAAGVVPGDLDYKAAYTTDFVGAGVGLDLKK